jgi:hypothetical protein
MDRFRAKTRKACIRKRRNTKGLSMPGLAKKSSADRSKIDVEDADQIKRWTKALKVSRDDLLRAIEKVGNAAAAVKKELRTTAVDKPLQPDDFPVQAAGNEIVARDGTPIAATTDTSVATDIADRLNSDEARREEDKWSA